MTGRNFIPVNILNLEFVYLNALYGQNLRVSVIKYSACNATNTQVRKMIQRKILVDSKITFYKVLDAGRLK